MKKIFSTFGFWLTVAIFTLIPLLVLLTEAKQIAIIIGNGSLLKGVIILPFAIAGFINVFRGFCYNLEQTEDKNKIKKYWQFVIYLIFTILSYVALFLAIKEIF